MANINLLSMFNNWTGWGELIIGISAFSYFALIGIESALPMFPDVYKFMGQSLVSPVAWLGVLFTFMSILFYRSASTRVSEMVKLHSSRRSIKVDEPLIRPISAPLVKKEKLEIYDGFAFDDSNIGSIRSLMRKT